MMKSLILAEIVHDISIEDKISFHTSQEKVLCKIVINYLFLRIVENVFIYQMEASFDKILSSQNFILTFILRITLWSRSSSNLEKIKGYHSQINL